MKQVLLMRHAKSSWADGGITDFERPLNKRGKRVAPNMAKYLASQQAAPELIISSPAARAAATANMVSEAIAESEPIPIRYEPNLYHAPAQEYLRVLATADLGEISRLMFVGHNPGLEDLVESLTGKWEILPTAAIVQLEFEASGWQEISPCCDCKMLNIWRPKEVGID